MFIYQIKCQNEIYIGSTNNLKNRIIKHKYCCNKESQSKYNLPIYKYIREHGGFENVIFSVVELLDVGEDVKKKEQEYINRLKPSLNTHSAYQPIKNKKEYDAVRYYNNKIKCECCGVMKNKHNLEKHKLTKKYINYLKSLS